MNERFIKLPAFFYEDGLIWFHDLYINPFQIESFTENDITYTDPDGLQIVKNGSTIITKSGAEHDINLSPEELMPLLR